MTTEAPFYEDISPETCLRLMDQAMIDWLGTVRLRQQFAKVVTGWGSRQFTQTHQTHQGKPVKQAIPLPMMTLLHTGLKPDANRWTKSPVRMLRFGPSSRSNVMYYADAVTFLETAWTGNGSQTVFTGYSLTRIPVRSGTVTLSFTVAGGSYTETAWTGNNVRTVFTGYTLLRLPVRPGTIVLTFTIGGVVHTEADTAGVFTNGSGHIVSSSVDYTTGAVSVTFNAAPGNLTALSFQYTVRVTYTETDQGGGTLTNTSGKVSFGVVDYATGAVAVTFTTAPDDTTDITVRYSSTTSDSRDKILHCPFPLPVTVSYQVDIWTKTMQDMRALRTGILMRFGQVHPTLTYIVVTFPNYGPKQLYVELSGDTDNSELETQEEERELRHTISLDIHGWIFKEPYIVKTVKNVHQVYVAAGGPPPPGCDLSAEAFTDWYDNPAHYHLSADGSQITSIDESPQYAPPNRVVLTVTYADGEQVIGP